MQLLNTFQDSLISLVVKLSFIINGLELLILVIVWRFIPPQVPLFYSRPWGDEQLVDKIILFFIPAVSLVFNIINLLLGNYFLGKEKLLAKFFIFTNFLINLLLIITLVEILFLTTF
jgi:hypothetical protein